MFTVTQIQRQIRRTRNLIFNADKMAAILAAAGTATLSEVEAYVNAYNSSRAQLTSLNNMIKVADADAKELTNNETYKKINALSGTAPVITASWVTTVKIPGLKIA